MMEKKNEKRTLEGDENRSWLQRVTEQSWEPELLISGLAIYATIQLPDLLWRGYEYYKYNLQSGTGIFDEVLPMLIYAVFTSVAYVLMTAFIAHFVVRAFWVGFIGLISVYREGIQYDKLPYSRLYRKQAKKKLGTAEHMATQLDNISSLIFSIAFGLVLVMIAVALLYFIFFLLYNVLKLFLGPEIFEAYASVLFPVLGILAMIYIGAIVILNLERFRTNPKAARWHFILSWQLSSVIMPLVYKPVQFISLTFLSNISTKRFVAYYIIFLIAFVLTLFGVMASSEDLGMVNTRDYFATRSASQTLNSRHYSSFAVEHETLWQPAIERPEVTAKVLPLFIPYPKMLDEKLSGFCEEETVPDSLENFRKRELRNEQRIGCAERFFSFQVDDSVNIEADLMFTNHAVTGQYGFISYLILPDLSVGKHFLRISRKPVDENDTNRSEEGRELTFESEIPFWVELD